MNKKFINHEKIHHRQYFESLYLAYFIGKIEYWYARIILKYSHLNAYLYECTEQEAYINQHDMKYLERRRSWSFLKYIPHKSQITFRENSEVAVGKM